MIRFWHRALRDIRANKFLNTITILTIALAVLIVSTFGLLAVNLNALMTQWRQGIRILVYLKPKVSEADRKVLGDRIRRIEGVSEITLMTKEEGLNRMKERMRALESILADLDQNPLPDVFEVRPETDALNPERVERMVQKIQKMDGVEEATYGKVWLNRFAGLANLFRIAGTALGGLFIMAAVFIVANTIRLVLYSRQQEIEIMRLIGAADRFIKTPFYIQGVLQGLLGGALGLGVLYGFFRIASANIGEFFPMGYVGARYFSAMTVSAVMVGAMAAGWIGCFLSLKGFLKR